LIVTQYFWPENFKVNDLAEELQRRGHQVTILTGKPNYPGGDFYPGYGWLRKSQETYKGCRVVRSPLIPRGKGSAFRLALNYFSFAALASLIGPLLCRDHYDAIFVFETSPVTVGIPAIVMKKLLRKPLFFWVQDLWPDSLTATGMVRSPAVLSLVESLVKGIYHHCDVILMQSEAFRETVLRQGVPEKKLRYLPNWAEPHYTPLERVGTEACTELPEGFRLVFAGNLGEAQDWPTLLAAAELLREQRDIHWVIIGDGRHRAWIGSQIVELGLTETVHLIGPFRAEAMPVFFHQADALLVTLRRDPLFALTIPSKLQTYLACGRPILSAVGGETNRIVVQAGAGSTCEPGDPAALASAVLRLYAASVEERMEMGRRAFDCYQDQFERKRLIDRLEGWLAEQAGTGARP